MTSENSEKSSNTKGRRKKTKRKKERLPRKLIHIPNADKNFHESWEEGDDPLNFPHPFRLLLASGGRPNLRKTNTAKNVVLRQEPPFEIIHLLHCGGSVTKEWDDFNVNLLDEIPEPYDTEVFNPDKKTLLIIEDWNFRDGFSSSHKKRIDRIFGYTSTHQNCSIICTSQGFFAIPHIIRLMSNVIIVWKTKDMDSMETIRRRVDMKKDDWLHIFNTYIKEPHDFLLIDNTKNTPYPLRINGYKILKINY